MLGEVIGTYSKDQARISTNACRLYPQSRGLTPGCNVGGGVQAFSVCAYVLIHPSDTSNSGVRPACKGLPKEHQQALPPLPLLNTA